LQKINKFGLFSVFESNLKTMSFMSLIVVSAVGTLLLSVIAYMSLSHRKQQEQRERKQKKFTKQLRHIENLRTAVPTKVLPAVTHLLLLQIQLGIIQQLIKLSPRSANYRSTLNEINSIIEELRSSPLEHSIKELEDKKQLQNAQSVIANICKMIVSLNKRNELDLGSTQSQLKLLRPLNNTIRVKIYLIEIDEAKKDDKPKVVEHYLNQALTATRGHKDAFSTKVHNMALTELEKLEHKRTSENEIAEQLKHDENSKWALFDADGRIKKRSIYD